MEQILSPEQLRQFHNEGFLVLPSFITEAECLSLSWRAAEIVEEQALDQDRSFFSTRNQEKITNDWFLNSGDKVRLFMETDEGEADGHRVNKIGHGLHDEDPVFKKFSRQRKFVQLARELGIAEATPVQSMYIFKQPRIGGEVVAHQDSTFLWTEPQSCVGFWMAVQDATKENGCLWVLPKGQEEDLRKQFVRDGKGGVEFVELKAKPLPDSGYVPVEVKAGTLVLLHGNLPHYSEANRSDRPREAYALHVISGQSKWPESNWLQRGLQKPFVPFNFE